MSTKTALTPVFLKFSDLEINPSLSGRTEKEIKENAKILAKIMEAHGEWDSMQPGQVAMTDGKPRVIAGFTRVAAAESLGYKGGWFFEVAPQSELDVYLKCITTNEGKPISRFQQGCRFQTLRDGVVSDDFAGVKADPKIELDWAIQPMELQAIADKVGKHVETIKLNILICESSPEIRNLLETDQISTNVVVKARQWTKKDDGEHDDVKALKMLRAAIRQAGGDRVTQKHLEAVKTDYVKQKAVAGKAASPSVPAASVGAGTGTPEKGEESGSGSGEGSQGEPELFSAANPDPQPAKSKEQIKKQKAGIRDSLIATIAEFDREKGTNQMEDKEIEGLADWLVSRNFIVSETPF